MRGHPLTDQPESFPEVVAAEFGFLVDRGFRCSVESDRSVRYESPNGVFVHVFRDPRDRHVGFKAGLVTRPRDALNAGHLERITGGRVRADYSSDDSAMRIAVVRRARLLRDYGERILSGDESILEEASALNREYTKRYTKKP